MLHIIWNLTVIGMVTYLFIIFMRAVCELLIWYMMDWNGQ